MPLTRNAEQIFAGELWKALIISKCSTGKVYENISRDPYFHRVTQTCGALKIVLKLIRVGGKNPGNFFPTWKYRRVMGQKTENRFGRHMLGNWHHNSWNLTNDPNTEINWKPDHILLYAIESSTWCILMISWRSQLCLNDYSLLLYSGYLRSSFHRNNQNLLPRFPIDSSSS